jgi:hypothetical protein
MALTSFAQNQKKDSICNCSSLIALKSFFWKKDSLANDGYRLCSFNELQRCKIDEVTISYLKEKFGNPNKIERTNHGIEYVYFYYDYRQIPREVSSNGVVNYVSFHFKDEKAFLNKITDGHYD